MKFLLVAAFALSILPALADQVPAIRLTLVQGVPVTTADVTGAVSVCLEPYKSAHNQLSVYDGVSTWVSLDVAPSTYCLSAAGLTANTNYDIRVTNSGGVPLMSWSAPWSNDTTPEPRALQDGIDVDAADHTQRIIGAVHVTSIAGQLEDSHTHRWLSNYYDPEPREMWVVDPAPTWTYSVGNAYEQAHANPANQLDYIVVVPRLIGAHVQGEVLSSGNASLMVGIGLDGSLGNVAQINQHASVPTSLASNSYPMTADYIGTPGIGHHTVLWLEHGFQPSSGPPITQTWFGSIPPWVINGITGLVRN